jgi:uncharacterized protein (DUF697 family)
MIFGLVTPYVIQSHSFLTTHAYIKEGQLMKAKNTPNIIDPTLDLDAIREECLSLMKTRAYISAGVSAIPVPLLDIAVDAGMLTQLLPEISIKFGLEKAKMEAINFHTGDIRWRELGSRSLAFAGLVATRGATRLSIRGLGTRLISREVVKFIPLGGSIIAATMGYFVFKRITTNHIDECYALAKDLQTNGNPSKKKR